LLANSTESLRRSGARVDAARAALDYVVAAHGMPDPAARTARELAEFALTTFESAGTPHDLRLAQTIAQRAGISPASV
jgi:hypothetical protein